MGTVVSARLAWFLLAFSVLPTGVMAQTLDTDLIGVIAGAVCVTVILIVIIIVIAYCCFRRLETKKKSTFVRKDSASGSANDVSTRWTPRMVPSGMPVYSVPTEPVMYAVPASHYYLGYYAPKFLDAETLEYMRQQETSSQKMAEDGEEQHVRRSEHVTREERQVTMEGQTPGIVQVETTTSQPNGHVLQDFSASSVNYKVIRKQHKHEKMPEWLRKSYDENEQSMDLEGEGSTASSVRSSSQLVTPPTPEQAVRAQVSAYSHNQDYEDVMVVPKTYTVVDFVDPERQERPSSIVDKDEERQVTATTVVSASNGLTTNTTTITETIVSYKSQNEVVEERQTSEGVQVLPASTSTPRAQLMREIEMVGGISMESSSLKHNRMRKPGQGSLTDLPQAAAEIDVLF